MHSTEELWNIPPPHYRRAGEYFPHSTGELGNISPTPQKSWGIYPPLHRRAGEYIPHSTEELGNISPTPQKSWEIFPPSLLRYFIQTFLVFYEKKTRSAYLGRKTKKKSRILFHEFLYHLLELFFGDKFRNGLRCIKHKKTTFFTALNQQFFGGEEKFRFFNTLFLSRSLPSLSLPSLSFSISPCMTR